MDENQLTLIRNSAAAPLVILMVAVGQFLAGHSRAHNQVRNAFRQLREAVDLPEGPDQKARILMKDLNRIVEGASNLEDLIEDMESVMRGPSPMR